MAGEITIYNRFKADLFRGDVDLASDTIKVALVTGYSPTIDGDLNWDDVSSLEVDGAGYTAGGATLANVSVTQDDAADEAVFDAGDVEWADLDVGTPSHAIIYMDSGTASTSPLIAYVVLGVASNGQPYKIEFAAEGVLVLE